MRRASRRHKTWRMRIAHLGPTTLPPTFRRGGAIQRRIRELARAQQDAGHTALVLATDVEKIEGLEVRSIPAVTRRPFKDVEFIMRAQSFLADFRPDVVHYHSLPLAALFHRAGAAVLSY